MLTVKTPIQVMNDDKKIVTTYTYLNQQGKMKNAVSFTPNFNISDMNFNVDLKNIDDEKAIWNKYSKKSAASTANIFNIVNQFSLLNNQFGMQDYITNNVANNYGSNSMYDYELDKQISNGGKDTLPMFFIGYTG
jgi:hypothetical protein